MANHFPFSKPSCIFSFCGLLTESVGSKGPGKLSIKLYPLRICRVNHDLTKTGSPIGYCLSRDGTILHMSYRKNWGRTICIMILFHYRYFADDFAA